MNKKNLNTHLREVLKGLNISSDSPSPIILGLSGGLDSVVLLDLLASEGFYIIAAHCNFNLRGEESYRDERWVRDLMSNKYKEQTLLVNSFDTISYAKKRKLSLEMAARELRYDWFRKLKEEYHGACIMVAHHAGDQAETLLLNLCRGCGGLGLIGMKVRSGDIVRPLLDIPRISLERYADEHQLTYVIDSSNEETRFRRNYIRKVLLPTLQKLNPSIEESLLKSSHIFAQEQAIISEALEGFASRRQRKLEDSIDLRDLGKEKHAPLLLYRLLDQYGFTATQVEEVLRAPSRSGARFITPNGEWEAELFRETLYMRSSRKPSYRSPLQVMFRSAPFPSSFENPSLCIDPEKVTSSLEVRHVKRGDTFRPFGMQGGSKSVHTYLKEKGIPLIYRELCPVVVDGSSIVALPPWEIDSRYAIPQREKGSHEEVLWIETLYGDDPLSALVRRLREKS